MYKKLKHAVDNTTSHFKVYLKKEIPEYFHIKNNKNTGDILILADPGWFMRTNKENNTEDDWERGTHGYSNFVRNMNPGFLAFGPMFRAGFRKRCVKTVDIYSLICHILDINAEKNDGNFKRVKPLLKEYAEDIPEDVVDAEDPIHC